MSELKADKTFVFGEECEAYKKSEADKVIAEKDKVIDELKREHHRERHEYIEMVAQLKAKLVEQESDNRKLKRALWMARAWGANQRIKYLDLFLTGRAHAIRKYKWIKITSKCRAKAEQYK